MEGGFEHLLVGVSGGHELALCEISAFDGDNVADWTPIHGSFYFDPWDERGGDADPWYYTPGVGPKPNPKDYNPAFTAAMSVVVAGNTTVSVRAAKCPRAGCPTPDPVPTMDADWKVFYWSDDASWDRTGNPAIDVPSDYADIEIPEKWTVILDVETPVMRVLTVRGKLLVKTDAAEPIALHAHFIDVRGGEVTLGNSTDPFLGPRLSMVLHGDAYVWQGMRNGECSSGDNPLNGYYPACGKKVNVRGKFEAFGRPRKELSRLAADANAGDYVIFLAEEVDWEAGEHVLLTGIVNNRAVRETREVFTVSGDGLTVSFTEPLQYYHCGVIVDEEDARPRNGHLTDGTPGRIVMDTRDTAALLDRNVHFEAGNDPMYDTVSGVPMRDQGYGWTIHLLDIDEEPLPGWLPDMKGYHTEGKKALPVGRVDIQYVRFHDAGKQLVYACGLNTCARQYPCISGLNVAGSQNGDDSSHQAGESRENGVVGVLTESSEFRHAKSWPRLRGVVSTSPRTGLIVNGVPGMILENNVLLGHELHVVNADAQIVNNLLYTNPGTGEGACILTCSENWPVEFIGDGQLTVTDNRVMSAYVGMHIKKACPLITEWSNNVAMGNRFGVHLRPGCTSLPLETYRNGVGVGVDWRWMKCRTSRLSRTASVLATTISSYRPRKTPLFPGAGSAAVPTGLTARSWAARKRPKNGGWPT